jgi:superfamily II DNA/RNA helicase
MHHFFAKSAIRQFFVRYSSKNVLVSPNQNIETRVYQEGIFQKMSAQVQEALASLKITAPSDIQQLVIPEILGEKDVLFASQTGTGKTLAYLLPILQKTKLLESNGVEPLKSRPKVLIFVPTKELVTQVVKTIKSVTYHVKLSSVGLRSDYRSKRNKESLDRAVDIVVSTPGIFSKMYDSKQIFMSQLHTVIIDEADSMLSKGFDEAVIQRVINPAKNIEKTKERKANKNVTCESSNGLLSVRL